MKEYEIVYIVKPDLSEEDQTAKSEYVEGLIVENGGEIKSTDDWGKRVLAYEISHYSEGRYIFVVFQLPPQGVESIQERLDIDEEILRHQIVARST